MEATVSGRGIPSEVHGDGRFVADRSSFEPGYVRARRTGRLVERVEQALAELSPCTVCPRPCRDVDRLSDQVGACRIGRRARVMSAFPHLGEEDVLRGWRGSGTIFMAGCNLRCVFCQNWDVSQSRAGCEVSAEQLARLMLDLQSRGCHNINVVTPEHVVPQLLEALPLAADAGLNLPLVYNTSAYDSPRSIELLDGIVDVYMPDVKLLDPEHCHRYLGARDYSEIVRQVLPAMHDQVGDLVVDDDGLALSGVLVRHLVMPGLVDEARAVLAWLAQLSPDLYVNVMGQYRPDHRVLDGDRYAEIARPTSSAELRDALVAARAAGLWRLDTRWRPLGPLLSGR